MQYQYHAYLSVKARACLLAVLMTITGCSQLVIDPLPTILKQRMNKVIILVHADTGLAVQTMDEIAVGAAESAEYAAEKIAVSGAKIGGGMIVYGCIVGLETGIGWFILCPVGLVTGTVVSFGSVVVGGPVGAIYGATQAHSQDEIDMAQATLYQTETIFDKKLASIFRDQFISAIQSNTHTSIIEVWHDNVAVKSKINDEIFPIIITVKIDSFNIIRDGRLTPDLKLQMNVSTDLYDTPEAGRRYTGSWTYSTDLGNYFALTEQDGSTLNQKIDSALQSVAQAIVRDIFLNDKHAADQIGKETNVEITSGKQFASTQQWFIKQKQKANCGDIKAQVDLGKAYGDIDLRIYGWRGRDALINGYYWLHLAQLTGDSGNHIESYLSKLKKRMKADEITQAEKRAQEWRAIQCVK